MSTRSQKKRGNQGVSTSKKKDDGDKRPSVSTKSGSTKQKEAEKEKRREAALLRFSNSYAAIKKKWVDLSSRKHWPLQDIMFGGNRTVVAEGCQIIMNSLADCALLEGEEREDPELLKKGIVEGHYLTLRKTDKGVICVDGNHKLAVYRDEL